MEHELVESYSSPKSSKIRPEDLASQIVLAELNSPELSLIHQKTCPADQEEIIQAEITNHAIHSKTEYESGASSKAAKLQA
jgi:hypothetical protein